MKGAYAMMGIITIIIALSLQLMTMSTVQYVENASWLHIMSTTAEFTKISAID